MSFCFCFLRLQTRRAYRPKQASTKQGSATTVRPGFGSSAGCFTLRLPGEGGTPLAPGGLGRRRRQPPLGPGRTTTPARRRPLPAKERTGRRARCAHAAHLLRAHATRTRRVLRAHRPQPSNSEIRVSDVRASSLDRYLVGKACVARTRLRVDLRDSSGRQARERFLRR